MHPDTIAVHGGATAGFPEGAVATPIYQSVSYEFESADHAAALFNLEVAGHRYGRISNPTLTVLEQRLALLERGIGALVVSSGQAALSYALLNLVRPGCNIVATPQLYGTTHTLLRHVLPGMGTEVRFAASDRPADTAALIDEQTSAVFCETVGNPAGNVIDIEAFSNAAHRFGVPLVVDNTIATPFLLRPIEFGADIVVHSLTKFLGGHGAALGGAIIDSGRFDWAEQRTRFPMFSEPDTSYHDLIYSEHFGASAYIARCRSVFLRATGATLSPHSAFLLLLGIETAAIRMDRHVENAAHIAQFLACHPLVNWVNYLGFADNPYRPLVQRQLCGRAPSVFSFGLAGGYPAAARFYDALGLFKRVVNLGDVRSLACHPASTTHRQMTVAQQRRAGVSPEMIRLSVGIEGVDDLIADLAQALTASGADAMDANVVADLT
jgi:O-acetylhomoserine (thiol)-lyase